MWPELVRCVSGWLVRMQRCKTAVCAAVDAMSDVDLVGETTSVVDADEEDGLSVGR